VYAIGGSTHDLLERRDATLEHRLTELDARIAELQVLRHEIGRYRGRVRGRISAKEGA
jgi:hypothetical protein